MKKIGLILLSIGIILTSFFKPKIVMAEEDLSLNAPSAILVETRSRKILFEKNADQKLFPASMTKMMGMYLVLKAKKDGKITFEEKAVCSQNASSMGGTQIYLAPNEEMKVEDLFKAVAINSANDAIVCLGEHVFGSYESFISTMNKTAKEMGMNNTHFNNATGFDDSEHYTTARDMSILACNLLTYGEEVLKYTRMRDGYVRENTDNPFWLVSTNKLLKYYDGMDGLKTGFTSLAGYNLTATASKNQIRFVSVVMKEETIEKRSQDTIRLLNYGFSRMKACKTFQSGQTVGGYTFENSTEKEVSLITKEDIFISLDVNESIDDYEVRIEMKKCEPPIDLDDVVAELVYTHGDTEFRFPLYSKIKVKQASFWDYVLRAIKLMF